MTGIKRHILAYPFSACLALAGVATPALSADPEDGTPPGLDLTLNSTVPTEAGTCRLTFVISNWLTKEIGKMVLETVLFDPAGQVVKLTLFDFGTLPVGRARVRQFDLADLACDGVGQVLINGVDTCEGGDLIPADCLEALRLKSEADIEVTG